jgi:hypothetical protein
MSRHTYFSQQSDCVWDGEPRFDFRQKRETDQALVFHVESKTERIFTYGRPAHLSVLYALFRNWEGPG